MKLNQISAIIIFHGRHSHLFNVLKGLENGKEIPEEVILIEINEKKTKIHNYNLEIHHYLISDFNSSSLPIATARNLGATKANFDILAFLDVDCIPSPGYIFNMRRFTISNRALYMGKPLYLTDPVKEVETFTFTKKAIEHPVRPNFKDVIQTENYGMFWSLCFFISSNLFFEIGGFDESYSGYGAEDTDLSFKCQSLSIPLILTSLKVYHQPHIFLRPPLKSIKSIVKNCNCFFSKWSFWPMQNHLKSFDELGYISWSNKKTEPIKILKEPAPHELEKAIVENEPYA